MKLEDAKKRLRQRYIDGLPAKIAVLEQGLRPSGEVGAHDAIRRLAHQISGSAASFGFPELGELAKRAELAEPGQLVDTTEQMLSLLRGIVRVEAPEPTRILVVDDDPAVCELLEETLGKPGQIVKRAMSAEQGRQMISAASWDLILLDLILPDGDGRQLLAEMRSVEHANDTPVIVLSSNTNSLVKNECAAYGVDKFIEKPLDVASIPTMAATSIQRQRTVHREAYVDELTELQNRSGFRIGFERLLLLSRRHKRPMCIAMLDLDHFKSFNDNYGHDVGDKVLKIFGETLRAELRDSDIVGRWGGEEFICGLPETEPVGAAKALRKVAEVLRTKTEPPLCPKVVTFSGGVALVHGAESLDLALLRADQMLYSAKRSGRDRVLTGLEEGVDSHKPTLLLVEDDLDNASLLLRDLADDYRVTHVDRGDTAMELTAKSRFDILILDHDLPGPSGIEITEAVRATPHGRECPIVMLTAAGSEELIERAFNAGANDYVVKPYRKRELMARLARVIRQKR